MIPKIKFLFSAKYVATFVLLQSIISSRILFECSSVDISHLLKIILYVTLKSNCSSRIAYSFLSSTTPNIF